jgi:hypothetical protein
MPTHLTRIEQKKRNDFNQAAHILKGCNTVVPTEDSWTEPDQYAEAAAETMEEAAISIDRDAQMNLVVFMIENGIKADYSKPLVPVLGHSPFEVIMSFFNSPHEVARMHFCLSKTARAQAAAISRSNGTGNLEVYA